MNGSAFCTTLPMTEVGFAAAVFLGAVFLAAGAFFAFTATVFFATGFAAGFAAALAVFLAAGAAFFVAGALLGDFLLDVFLLLLDAVGAIRSSPFRAKAEWFARPTASDTMRMSMLKRRTREACRVVALATLLLGSVAGAAEARVVAFPITVDERFLATELARTAYTDADATARVFDDGTGCNSLVLSAPELTTEAGQLRVRSAGEAHAGFSVGGLCLLPLSWHGFIELLEEPRIDEHAPIVRFEVVDSKILGIDGKEPLLSGTLWGWMKPYVHTRLETRIDLRQPLEELRGVLPAFGIGAPGSALDGVLASLALENVIVDPGAVQVRVQMQLPELPAPGATPEPSPVAPLTKDELLRWQTALQQWDAFLTFVVKVTGSDTTIGELRRALLGILLDERYALTEALASPDASVHDPVRPLFLRTWTRLGPVLRQVGDTLPADQALRYLSFVSAGDALEALDALGPETGIEISADGLRRLARMVAPGTTEDPLSFGLEVDPQLRELFGFGAPLPPPEDNPDVEPEPTSWLSLGGTAWAADAPDRELVKRLNAWAPSRADVAEYAPLARQLLDSVTAWLLARHEIDAAHEAVFRALVPAAAWQESCWRQFVKRNGKLVPLTSSVGSVGIMQINVGVWRGFYDPGGLKRDIAYNARAGGEILSRYWTDYAVARREQDKGGGPDALARATYAAYNGGPGELSRYREHGRSKRERAVDDDFFAKYQRVKAGDTLAVLECFAD